MTNPDTTRLRVILHNIRSVHNVASIFRTADGAGAEKIYLTGYTPGPTDRFERKRQAFEKVALGAGETVAYERADDIVELIGQLQTEGATVVACEQQEGSADIFSYECPEDLVVVLGNEVEGVETKLLELMDEVVEIPMHGEKRSLNVSVAAGVALYVLKKR